MGMTVLFGSGSALRVVPQDDSSTRRYFFNCTRCKAVQTVDYTKHWIVVPGKPQTRRESWGTVINGWWYALGSYPNQTERCTCGGRIEATELKATYSPTHVCNARCMGSTRGVCECSCGGKNHGGAHRLNGDWLEEATA
jgi:hypothetical protein